MAAHCADRETVHVVGLNDTNRALSGRLRLCLVDFRGTARWEEETEVRLEAEAATPLHALAVRDLPSAAEEVFLTVRFVPEGGTEGAALRNELFLAPYKRCPPQNPHIVTRLGLEGEEALVELSSDLPAFFVSVDAAEIPGVFEAPQPRRWGGWPGS